MARILLVDDDPVFIRLMRHALRQGAYQISVASDGKEALAKVEELRPDLVVLDVEMPEVDGYRVLHRLRADPGTRNTLVILMTSRDQPGDVALGLDIGADFYLTKPFKAAELASLVDRALRVTAIARSGLARE